MADMKPCPYCAADAQRLEVLRLDSQAQAVLCLNCGAGGPSKRTQAEAINAWNCRTDDERVQWLERELQRLAGRVSDSKGVDDWNLLKLAGWVLRAVESGAYGTRNSAV